MNKYNVVTGAENHYTPQERTSVSKLFSKIAPHYDLINDLQSAGLHRYWKRTLIAQAAPKPHEWALDLCCGTGDLALASSRKGARTVGVDFSPAMLQIASKRSKGKSLPHAVTWLCADSLRLPFPDESFDVATMGYGLRNLSNLDHGLREIHRVLKPSGRFLSLDFGKPPHPLWRTIYFAHLRLMVPLFGRLFCGDAAAYRYILESLKQFPGPDALSDRFQAAGFHRPEVIRFLGGCMTLHVGRLHAPE